MKDQLDDSLEVYTPREIQYLDKYLPLCEKVIDEPELYDIIINSDFHDDRIKRQINQTLNYYNKKGQEYGWHEVGNKKTQEAKPVEKQEKPNKHKKNRKNEYSSNKTTITYKTNTSNATKYNNYYYQENDQYYNNFKQDTYDKDNNYYYNYDNRYNKKNINKKKRNTNYNKGVLVDYDELVKTQYENKVEQTHVEVTIERQNQPEVHVVEQKSNEKEIHSVKPVEDIPKQEHQTQIVEEEIISSNTDMNSLRTYFERLKSLAQQEKENDEENFTDNSNIFTKEKMNFEISKPSTADSFHVSMKISNFDICLTGNNTKKVEQENIQPKPQIQETFIPPTNYSYPYNPYMYPPYYPQMQFPTEQPFYPPQEYSYYPPYFQPQHAERYPPNYPVGYPQGFQQGYPQSNYPYYQNYPPNAYPYQNSSSANYRPK